MSKATEEITFEIDEQTEIEVNKVLAELGMDMDTAITLFFEEIVRTKAMPVDISGYKWIKRVD